MSEEFEQEEPDQLKQILAANRPPYDPDQSLNRVLSHAKRQTATRDIVGFFVSWIWLLFAGFGASMHQAYVKRQQQETNQKITPTSRKSSHQQGD